MSIGRVALLMLTAGLSLRCSSQKDSYVVIHADVDCDLPRVFQLQVTVSNGTSSDQKLIPEAPGAEMGFPSDFVLVVPDYRTGWLGVSVNAVDQNSTVIGQGSVEGQLDPGARIDLQVQLSLPPALGGNAIPTPTTVSDGGVSPTPIVQSDADSGGPAYVQVAVGAQHTCAVRADSTLWCWGNNAYGQLRQTTTSSRLTPVNVGGTAWNRVSCGQSHTCATRTDGSLSCWGNNGSEQLGDATVPSGGGMAEVTGHAWTAVAAGSYQTCAIASDATAWCWGDDTNGQLGIGAVADQQGVPMQVQGAAFAQVSSDFLHTCAIKTDSTLWCWGLDSDGQAGDFNGTYHTAPVALDGQTWASVSTGLYHTCALKADRSLWCWGGNRYGQLGSATIPASDISSTATPVQVTGDAWLAVSAGQSHTCAIAGDSSLWCWGDNSAGQLGNGSVTAASTPGLVHGTQQAWSAVAAGVSHTCAIAVDGSLWCWGNNASGQLGIGRTSTELSPVKVNH